MEFPQKKFCRQNDWISSTISSVPLTSPSDHFDSISNNVPVDASMTLEGLLPLDDAKNESSGTPDAGVVGSASANEIVTAFASLDTEVEERLKSYVALSSEFQCRYRRGKCSYPRTLKKNGSMHTYCEYHRQLSVRNQRVFDHKKRHQRKKSETQGEQEQTSSP